MIRVVIVVCVVALFAQLSELKAQLPIETVTKEREAGFADSVTDVVDQMHGKWTINSANLLGAELPLDQFELLTVDKNGFALNVQKQTKRFEFAEFKRESKTILAKFLSPEYPNGLVYEISVSQGIIKIRYRTNGAHIPPAPTLKDNQLLVHTWTKLQTK